MKIIVWHLCIFSSVYQQISPHELIPLLYEQRVIQSGSFTLKSGQSSPLYVDMRMAFSSAHLLRTLGHALHTVSTPFTYDRICGVPYGAVPFATALALEADKPLIMLRKDAKKYGMQKIIDGAYHTGDRILLIEDVMTTGSSIIETITALEEQGLIVTDIIVLFDRQEGGMDRLVSAGYHVHAIMTATDLYNFGIAF